MGNGHGSGPNLVELGMALERPASSASTGSGTQKAAACPAGPGAQGPAMTQRSPKAGGTTSQALPPTCDCRLPTIGNATKLTF